MRICNHEQDACFFEEDKIYIHYKDGAVYPVQGSEYLTHMIWITDSATTWSGPGYGPYIEGPVREMGRDEYTIGWRLEGSVPASFTSYENSQL